MPETAIWIEPYLKDGAYIPTKQDILKLVVQSRNEFLLKWCCLHGQGGQANGFLFTNTGGFVLIPSGDKIAVIY